MMKRLQAGWRWGAGIALGDLVLWALVPTPGYAAPDTEPRSAGPVIVDLADGITPQSVATKYGIVPTQIYPEVTSGFAATVTERPLAPRVDRTVESITSEACTPAAYEEVITVSAYADYDGQPGGAYPGIPAECPPFEADHTIAGFSNYGRPIDISAPGVCSISTVPGGLYGYVEGTSFSAPLVAGGVALLKAKNPSISPARVRARLLALAEPGPSPVTPTPIPKGS